MLGLAADDGMFQAVIKKTRPLWNRVLWSISDSNRPPIDCEPIALPDELIPQVKIIIAHLPQFVQVGRKKIIA